MSVTLPAGTSQARVPLSVELHRQWNRTNPAAERPVEELVPFITRITWGDAVAAPWGGLSCTLQLFGADWRAIGPAGGDWIVVRPGHKKPAMGLYRVVSAAAGKYADSTGAHLTMPYEVTAESWLQAFARIHIYAILDKDSGGIGTLLSFQRRAKFYDATLKAMDGDLGLGLEALVREVGYLPMPPTLGGFFKGGSAGGERPYVIGTLGQSVGVIRDQPTAIVLSKDPQTAERAGTRGREAEPVKGATIPDFQSLVCSQGVSALDIIQGAFSADPNMVEMFPSLEDYNGEAPEGVPQTGLADAIGRVPCIVSRMRPWRAVALSDYAKTLHRDSAINSERFEEVTWDPDTRAQTIPPEDIIKAPQSQQFGDYINAVTVSYPKAADFPLKYTIAAGLPVFEPLQVALFGAALYEVNWPFLPHEEEDQALPGEIPKFPRNPGEIIDTIVLHDTAGWTVVGAQATFRASANPNDQGVVKRTSTHYIIAEDGTTTCLFDPAAWGAYHAGKWNRGSVGIDFVCSPYAVSPDGTLGFYGADGDDSIDAQNGWGHGTSPDDRKARRTSVGWTDLQVVKYTDDQVNALVRLLFIDGGPFAPGGLLAKFPAIAKLRLHPVELHVAEGLGATPETFAGVLAHGQTGTKHADGLYGMLALAALLSPWTKGAT